MTTESQYEEKRIRLRGEYIQQQTLETFGVKDPSAWLKEQSTANGPDSCWYVALRNAIPEEWMFAWEHAAPLLADCGKRMDTESVPDVFRKIFPLVQAANVPVYDSGQAQILVQVHADILSVKIGDANTFHVSALNAFPTREWTRSVLRSLLLCWKYAEPERANRAREKLCSYIGNLVRVFEKEAYDRFDKATFVVKSRNGIDPYEPDCIVMFDYHSPPVTLKGARRHVRQSERLLNEHCGVVAETGLRTRLDLLQGCTSSFFGGRKSHLTQYVSDLHREGKDQALYKTNDKSLILVTYQDYVCAPE
jgi:hypothetical protein